MVEAVAANRSVARLFVILGGGSSFSLIFLNKAGRGVLQEGAMTLLCQCLAWLLQKSLLGLRSREGVMLSCPTIALWMVGVC